MPSPSEGKNAKSSTSLFADAPAAAAAVPGSPSKAAAQSPADSAAKAVASEPPLTSTVAKTNAPSAGKATAPSHPTQGVKPPVPGGAAPPKARLCASSPPSSLPLKPSHSSPSKTEAAAAPIFIAPVAPSPTAAHGFLPPASFPRCSPTPPPLPRALSPHPSCTAQTSSSSSVGHHAAEVQEAPPVTAQPPSKK